MAKVKTTYWALVQYWVGVGYQYVEREVSEEVYSMESVIKQIELEIADDYKMFKNNPEVWVIHADKIPPDRNHPDL